MSGNGHMGALEDERAGHRTSRAGADQAEARVAIWAQCVDEFFCLRRDKILIIAIDKIKRCGFFRC